MLDAVAGANEDVRKAVIWYEDQRAGLGDKFFQELSRAMDRIAANPRRFGRLDRCPTSDDIRLCRMKRFPYLIYFRLQGTEILVLAVGHSSRKPLYWLDRLS